MYAELMNENVRIRAENVMLRKVVFALIAQADKDPFMSIGHFAEHGHASAALAEIRKLNDEQERLGVLTANLDLDTTLGA